MSRTASGNMKKILYIISNPFSFSRRSVGGNISSAGGVVNGFLSAGYHVDVISDSPIPTLEENSDTLITISYPFRKFRSLIPYKVSGIIGRILLKFDGIFFQWAMKLKVDSLVKANDYDFCYMRVSYNGHAIFKIVKKYKLDLVTEVNKPLSMGIYNNNDSMNWPNVGEIVKVPKSEILQYDASTVITIDSTLRAKWVLDFVNKSYKEKIIINPNGVDVNMFSPVCCSDSIKKEINVTDAEIVIGVASSFRWYNDIYEMCQIFQKVINSSDNIKFLVITGDNNKKTEIENYLSEFNIDHKVKILLQVPFKDMPIYLNCCDILISHFNFHGKWPHNCSIKHLEYLSLGKPVVATDVGEVNFAIEHNVNGILCNEGDVEGFAKSILTLSSDKLMRKKLGNAGRLKAVKELSWEKNTQRIVDALILNRNK
jgi:glycosyltransferase involved in cell wall biosynthesis